MSSGLRIGRYELGERLGTGGFGVVYHARDTELGRELAIKVLRPEYQTQIDVVQRFLKEARAAAKIDHPGIVTVFECGTISGTNTAQDGNAYIAMELLRGTSLTQHLEQRGRMSVADAVLIGRQVAAALVVAHAAGIVHRDLKPDNVFLLPDPLVKGGFRIKILDFGVAKLAEPKEVGVNTHSQMMLGTPKYMSPEQARSAAKVDQRTDVYTLGCMLYEMVTAQSPYEGPGAIDMIIQHTTAPIPSASAIVPGLPQSFDKLVRTMMEKEPEDRPDSMTAIDKALEAIQQEVVPPSIPPTPMRPKPPTTPPARPPPRPTPAPPPTGLTPTPAVSIARPPAAATAADSMPIRPARPTPPPPLPPARPTPQPPARPSPVALGTVAEASPFVVKTIDDDAPTTSQEAKTVTRPQQPQSRAPMLVVVGLVVAGAAAGIVYFITREKPSAEPDRPAVVADAAAKPVGDVAEIEKECASVEKLELWKDLKVCADRLKAHKPDAGAKLWKKADDEAANEIKFKGIEKNIKEGDLGGARDLVKRIGEESVYSSRAHKALEDAEANK